MDSTFSRYSPRLYQFLVFTQIWHFSGSRRGSFLIIARILPFSCTRPDSIIFRYLPWFYHFSVLFRTVFDTRTDSTFSRYSPAFHHFPVLTLILPFFDTGSDSVSVLARMVPFPGTRPNSIIFLYWPWFYHLPVLIRTVFRYSHGFYLFQVLARILSFSGTDPDSTIFWYWFG